MNSPLWAQFHLMWGKAKDGLVYHKEDWNELQRLIEEIERPSDTHIFTVPSLAVSIAAMLVEELRGFHVNIVKLDKEQLYQFKVFGKDVLPLGIRQWIAKANDTRPPEY